MKIELLEMGDEGDWECDIVHEDTSTTSFQATMETIPKSGNIPAAVGPGTSTRSSHTLSDTETQIPTVTF